MKRKIKVNNQTRIELASLFGVTQRSVEYALNFERNSVQACQIREAALQNGGRLVEIHEVDVTPTRTVKVLDQKGNLKVVFKEDHPTL